MNHLRTCRKHYLYAMHASQMRRWHKTPDPCQNLEQCWHLSKAGFWVREWCDPVSRFQRQSGSCVLDSLKWINCWLRESCENRVTVVQPGCHESWHKAYCNFSAEDTSDWFEVSEIDSIVLDIIPRNGAPDRVTETCEININIQA